MGFYMYWDAETDYGTKLRIKCHQRIERKAETIEGDLCTNWERIDGFGARLDLDYLVYHTDVRENFYENFHENLDGSVYHTDYENFYDDEYFYFYDQNLGNGL